MNQRQMSILTTLSNLEILTRSQIQKLHNTKSTRNTNFIMQSLKPYTNSIRLKENAYYLNKEGISLVGAKRKFKSNGQAMHKIMRNDAYIYFKPTEWRVEQEIKVGSNIIRPDAFYKSNGSYKFLEVDHLQRWNGNEKKMEKYKAVKDTKAFQNKFKYFPTIVWIVKYEGRIKKIKQLASKMDLPCEVYLYEEIK